MNTVEKRRADPAGFVIAGLLLVLAMVIFWDTSKLQLSSTYGLGPKAMPFVVAAGLALLAVGNFVLALMGSLPEREHADERKQQVHRLERDGETLRERSERVHE